MSNNCIRLQNDTNFNALNERVFSLLRCCFRFASVMQVELLVTGFREKTNARYFDLPLPGLFDGSHNVYIVRMERISTDLSRAPSV